MLVVVGRRGGKGASNAIAREEYLELWHPDLRLLQRHSARFERRHPDSGDAIKEGGARKR